MQWYKLLTIGLPHYIDYLVLVLANIEFIRILYMFMQIRLKNKLYYKIGQYGCKKTYGKLFS